MRKKRVAKPRRLAQSYPMTNDPYHYRVIARAITYISDNLQDQPKLEQVAGAVGLSPAHFQRVFSKWVGVSPKRYQQYLALNHAKTMLAERNTVLATSDDIGFSSSSRLHDLFLNWEAMSPGDFAKRGQGLTISYGYFPSPFGEMLIMGTDRGICGIGFTDPAGREASLSDLSSRWPHAQFNHAPETLNIGGLFEQGASAKLHLIGAPFQIKVWQALLNVPTGHVTTYSEIAAHIGNPKAVRAVGTAVGRNPISWLIPCHRALRKSGELGGYHWGLPTKRALLAWESARFEADKPSP